jgi:xanthine dehydrogenase accessory factor
VNEDARQIALDVLKASRGEIPPVIVATVIDAPPSAIPGPGAKLLLGSDSSHAGDFGGGGLEAAVLEDCEAALHQFPRSAVQARYYRPEGTRVHRLEARAAGAYEVMLEIIEASATLLIVGGGHIGLSLATMGAQVGFAIAVLDDREMYANAERFPMADRIMCGDFEKLLDAFPIGPTTYAVMVSRGHKQDETALRAVVGRGAAYAGMIGSKRRVSTVLRHLAEEGVPIEALESVHTPIGFDIGAETPEEIAVSILAEVIAVRRGGSGRPMREGRPPIKLGATAD